VHLFCVSAVQVNFFTYFSISILFVSLYSFLLFISSPIMVVLGQSLSRPWTRFETRLPYSLSDVTSEQVNGFSLTKWRKCYSRRYTRISKKVGQHTICLYVWTSCTIPGQVTGVFLQYPSSRFWHCGYFQRIQKKGKSSYEPIMLSGVGGGKAVTEHVLQLYNKSIHCVCARAQTYIHYNTKRGEGLVMCVTVVLLGEGGKLRNQ
jgi:hypothetical protein